MQSVTSNVHHQSTPLYRMLLGAVSNSDQKQDTEMQMFDCRMILTEAVKPCASRIPYTYRLHTGVVRLVPWKALSSL